MKYFNLPSILVIILTLTRQNVNAQLQDDFSDGDFSDNPTWVGDISEFEVESGQLNSNGPSASSVLHLSTNNFLVDQTTWEFLIDLRFSPSASNKVRIYLMSRSADLESSLEGYFIEIGQSGDDELKFYRQDLNDDENLLFTGESQLSGDVLVRIKVKRDCQGNWEMYTDVSGGTEFSSEGAVFTDNTYSSTSHFGFVCFHTSSRSGLFYFDDVKISSGIEINNASVLDSNTLLLNFNEDLNETSAENISNYEINNGIGIQSAVRDELILNQVTLGISELSTNSYTVTVENIEDACSSSQIPEPISSSFGYIQLELLSVAANSSTILELTFNDGLDQSSAENVFNYSVDNSIGSPSSAVLNDSNNRNVKLTFTNSFEGSLPYTLSYSGIVNALLNSEISSGSTIQFQYVIPLAVQELNVINSHQLELSFNLDLDEVTAQNHLNYFVDNEIGNPISTLIDTVELNKMVLTFDSEFQDQDYELTLNNVKDIGGNVISENAVVEFSYLPLKVLELEILAANKLGVTFNQNLDLESGSLPENYEVNFEIGLASNAIVNPIDGSEVELEFYSDFVNNNYTLTIDAVQNESRNAVIQTETVTFESLTETEVRSIVINEIFADPNPSIGLPSFEFVELFNRGDRTINIGEFELTGSVIPDFQLQPNEYVILCPNSGLSEYQPFGNVVGIGSWNTLSNSGEQIILHDNFGNVIDSLTFDMDWYVDEAKEDGGYSLEQINPYIICNYQGNWRASDNASGGSPGAVNSVFDNTPDSEGPRLINVQASDENRLSLEFNEPMDEEYFNTAEYIISRKGFTIESVVESFDQFGVILTLETALVSGNYFEISVSGLRDCVGNSIKNDVFILEYDIQAPVLERIRIDATNRISLLFDEPIEEKSAETESNFQLTGSDGFPSRADLEEENSNILTLTFENDFEPLKSNSISISNLSDLKLNVLSVPITSRFVYDQKLDTVLVRSINQIDVIYEVEVDQSIAFDQENYYVNAGIGNPVHVLVDEDNSELFHLIFDKNLEDNEDLNLSVKDIKGSNGEYIPTPEYSFVYDTRAPRVEFIDVVGSNSLVVNFDEKVDQASAESIENYYYEEFFSSSRELQSNDSSVLIIFLQEFEREVLYELSIDGVKDQAGNEIGSRIRKEFIYDIFSPELDSIMVLSPNELKLIFNEALSRETAETADNYQIGHDLSLPATAFSNLELPTSVVLSFDNDIPEESSIPISISNISDVRSNTISTTIEASIENDGFYISEILPRSQNQIEITYNKPVETSSALLAENYMINSSTMPISIIQSYENDRTFILTFQEALADKMEHRLQVSGIVDLNSADISNTDYKFLFDSRFENIELVGDNTIELHFDVGLNKLTLPEVSEFLVEPGDLKPISAIIDKIENSVLRLIFENNFENDISYTIAWPELINEYGNVIPSFSATFEIDAIPPELINVTVDSQNSLTLVFSEDIDSSTAEILSNYIIEPESLTITEAELIENHVIQLTIEESLYAGTEYTLTTSNIKDMAGNVMTSVSRTFSSDYLKGEKPSYNDLIISEIMADPEPEVGLPQSEYLELYNRSNKILDLGGLILADNTGATELSTTILPPNDYLLLVPSGSVDLFASTNKLSVSNWRSLNNSGETLSVSDGSTLIFSTSYDDSWYKNSDKENGGWSLEIIDTNNPCGEYSNWTASTHDFGGTPGLENLVSTENADNLGPQIIDAIALNELSIKIVFDEKLDPIQFDNSIVIIDPFIEIRGAELIAPENYEAHIILDDNLQAGLVYSISFEGTTDCLGNFILEDSNTASFRLPEMAKPGDLIINEILFNPRSGGVDFVEIYNKSEKAINLKEFQLSDFDNQGNPDLITEGDLVLNPHEFMVFTTDPIVLKSDYPTGDESTFIAVSPFPTLPDGQGSLVLMDSLSNVLDLFEYDEDYHFNLLDDVDGVSLERISFDGETNDPNNWKSAASTAGFATPGLMNSQFISNIQTIAILTIEPKVFIPDNTGMNDFTTIRYEFQNPGNFANINIYDAAGRLIRTIVQGDLLSTSGFFTWDGTDNNGSRARAGYYAVYFEIFDANGNKDLLKETVVLGTRF